MAHRAQCINKTNRPDPYDRISHIAGAGWKLSQATAIARRRRDAPVLLCRVTNRRSRKRHRSQPTWAQIT